MSIRRTRVFLFGGVCLGAVLGGGAWYVAANDDNTPAGAEQIPFEPTGVNHSAQVAADGEGGLWVANDTGLVHVDGDGQLIWKGVPSSRFLTFLYGLGGPWAAAVGEDGAAAGNLSALVTVAPGADEVREVEMPQSDYVLASASYLPDGDLLVSEVWHPRIDVLNSDGAITRRVLGPPGSGAEIEFDQDVQVAVVALPDGRIAFSTQMLTIDDVDNMPNRDADPDAPDGDLFVIDDGQLEEVKLDPPGRIGRIFPGPAGKLLALSGSDIAVVDPDTGRVDSVADLSSVRDELDPPGIQEPREIGISATVDGKDLVFIADEKLWRLEDAFD